jgi:hypothetical protein
VKIFNTGGKKENFYRGKGSQKKNLNLIIFFFLSHSPLPSFGAKTKSRRPPHFLISLPRIRKERPPLSPSL